MLHILSIFSLLLYLLFLLLFWFRTEDYSQFHCAVSLFLKNTLYHSSHLSSRCLFSSPDAWCLCRSWKSVAHKNLSILTIRSYVSKPVKYSHFWYLKPLVMKTFVALTNFLISKKYLNLSVRRVPRQKFVSILFVPFKKLESILERLTRARQGGNFYSYRTCLLNFYPSLTCTFFNTKMELLYTPNLWLHILTLFEQGKWETFYNQTTAGILLRYVKLHNSRVSSTR